MPEGPYRRRSARVLLVDGTDRILLFQLYNDPRRPNRGTYWITPGGGVDEGESLAEAAARELREETGLIVAPDALGPRVAETSGYADLGWIRGLLRDDFFFHRVDAHDVVSDGFEPHEHAETVGHRWWSLPELASTDESVLPLGLVPLLRDLLAGRVPAEAVRLPWHH